MATAKLVSRTFTRSITSTTKTKADGDISSVFPSLSGQAPEALPYRFQGLKQKLVRGKEDVLTASWVRLLASLREEVRKIRDGGSSIIPSVQYADVVNGNVTKGQSDEIRHRGCVVVRGVVARDTALDYKQRAREYIAANRARISAFPKDEPAVYGLYWSPSQVHARANSNLLTAQKFLLGLWHSSDPASLISTTHPLAYADRLRIRNPGDAKFALGPHSDGGSLERWEDDEYRRCYSKIFEGKWEEYDPFDAKHRIEAKQDLYNGAGACSMLRFFQGWLSMSSTGPGEGTLKVCPLLQQATAYLLLRPLMTKGSIHDLDTAFPGSVQGAGQQYNTDTHPDLALEDTMCSIPRVEPGDFVAWHCDSIHSVDKEHRGDSDSSVMYIPAVPMTKPNLQYLRRQREAAVDFSPPPDFPGAPGAGGVGEKAFFGQLDWTSVGRDGLKSMGMGTEPWAIEGHMSEGERALLRDASSNMFPCDADCGSGG